MAGGVACFVILTIFFCEVGCVKLGATCFLCQGYVCFEVALLFVEGCEFVAWDEFARCLAVFLFCGVCVVVFGCGDRSCREHRVEASRDVCGCDSECVLVWARFNAVSDHIVFEPCMVEWFVCVGLRDEREEEEDGEKFDGRAEGVDDAYVGWFAVGRGIYEFGSFSQFRECCEQWFVGFETSGERVAGLCHSCRGVKESSVGQVNLEW